MQTKRNNQQVAIIGGGPAGLVAAKSLLEEGLQPTLFEQSSNLGGQWNGNSISGLEVASELASGNVSRYQW